MRSTWALFPSAADSKLKHTTEQTARLFIQSGCFIALKQDLLSKSGKPESGGVAPAGSALRTGSVESHHWVRSTGRYPPLGVWTLPNGLRSCPFLFRQEKGEKKPTQGALCVLLISALRAGLRPVALRNAPAGAAAIQADRHYGMIAPGNHTVFNSLRGALPLVYPPAASP